MKTALASLLHECLQKIYSDLLYRYILAYSCHFMKEGGKKYKLKKKKRQNQTLLSKLVVGYYFVNHMVQMGDNWLY